MLVTRLLRAGFTPLLLLFVILGFVVPGRLLPPSTIMLPALALMVFVSAFRIAAERFREISKTRTAVYFFSRYILLPLVLWIVLSRFDPLLAIAVLLLTLAPAGAASPGVTALYGGNVALTIVLLVITSISAPFLIPLGIRITVAKTIDVDVMQVFRSLFLTIMIPLAVHLPVRRAKPVAAWIRENDSLFVVPTIGLLVVMVITGQKAVILQDPALVALYLLVSALLFAVYFFTGWGISIGMALDSRTSYALASGVNNTAMGIVIAYLYFPPEVSIFFVAAELAWVFGMIFFKFFLDRRVPTSS